MESTSKRTTEIDLHLNESEAYWLRGYMQNFMGGGEFTEGKKSKANRERLFNLLDEELEGT